MRLIRNLLIYSPRPDPRKVADRVGFEPTKGVNPYSLSRKVTFNKINALTHCVATGLCGLEGCCDRVNQKPSDLLLYARP